MGRSKDSVCIDYSRYKDLRRYDILKNTEARVVGHSEQGESGEVRYKRLAHKNMRQVRKYETFYGTERNVDFF